MLIVFGGLPGTVKLNIAGELARGLPAFYLRLGSLEMALMHSGLVTDQGI